MATHIVTIGKPARTSVSTIVPCLTVLSGGIEAEGSVTVPDGLTVDEFNEAVLSGVAQDNGEDGDTFVLLGGAVVLKVKGAIG